VKYETICHGYPESDAEKTTGNLFGWFALIIGVSRTFTI
tara:strand:- start:159 stop:275 length:117 start_codon:yes stop_codon:yes gene_type:complete